MTRKEKTGLWTGITIVVLIGAWFLFKLFSHSSDVHLKAVPKNAAAVVKINIHELAVKADPMKLMNDPAFKNIPATGKASVKKLIADPFSTGIDPLENIYGFVVKEDDATISALVFKVADAGDLEKFERGLGIDGGLEVENGIYYSEIDESRCIAWNDEAGILMAASGGDKKSLIKKYLSEGDEQSIKSSDNFNAFAGKTFDMGLYFDNPRLSAMGGSAQAFSSLGFSSGYSELIINFENDRIHSTFSNYPDKNSSLPFPLLKNSGPDPKQFAAIAPQAPLLYLGIAADMNNLFNIVSADAQMKENLAGLEMFLGLKDAELKKLFTGDISLSFTDFKDISAYDPRVGANIDMEMKQYEGMHNAKMDRASFSLNVPMTYISIGVSDDNRINTLLQQSGMQLYDSIYRMPGIDFIVYGISKNGHLLVTNDYYAAKSFAKDGKFNTELPAAVSKANAFSAFVDLNQAHIPVTLTESMKDNYNEATVDFFLQLIKPFKQVTMKNAGSGSELDIAVEPGEGNSFYRLITYYGKMGN